MIKALENLSDRITVNYEGEPCYDIVFSKDFSEIGNELKKFNIENKKLCIKAGEGFMQGIFISFGITEDDVSDGVRDGGFGSTDKQRKKEPILYAM